MRVWTVAAAAALIVSAQPAGARHASRRVDPPPPAGVSADPGKTIIFANSCAAGQRITVAATGDLLFHLPLEQEALTPAGSYAQFWKPVGSILANADLTYANFEGAAADGVTSSLEIVKDPGREWNNRVYSARQMVLSYNYHPSLIDDLINSGFDVVSTANNHALDRGPVGIDRTVANFEKRGLAFSGTRARDAVDKPFSIVTEVKGHNVAWLACTFDTNGFPDHNNQVLHCFSQRDAVLAEISRLAGDPQIDAVILTPHWGIEGSPSPEKRQRDLAQAAIEAGATAIVGTHPHVQGPWEKLTAKDGREGLVIYSTGNFISNQRHPEQRMGEIALLELTQLTGGHKMTLTAAGFVQTWVDITTVHRVTEAPRTMASRPVPAGNRVFSADLPKLPRACDAGQSVAESWGTAPKVTVAMLPAPPAKPAEPKSGAVIRDLPVVAAPPLLVAPAPLVVAAVQPVVRTIELPGDVAVASQKPAFVNAKLAGLAGLPTDGWLGAIRSGSKSTRPGLVPPALARIGFVNARLAGAASLPTEGWTKASRSEIRLARAAAAEAAAAKLAGNAGLPTYGWTFATTHEVKAPPASGVATADPVAKVIQVSATSRPALKKRGGAPITSDKTFAFTSRH